MQEDILGNENAYNNEPRPVFLKVLCILSYVFIGYSLLENVLKLVSGPASKDQMQAQKVQLLKSVDQFKEMDADFAVDLFQKLIIMIESINANFYLFCLTGIIYTVIGFIGVYMMWNAKKKGFHLYIIYSILMSTQLYFIMSPQNIPSFLIIWNLLFSGLFVFMYSRNLKWMK